METQNHLAPDPGRPTPSPISIFDYSDYRKFLADQYDRSRRRRKGFSLNVWARSVGLRSPSTLHMIIRGLRKPGPRLVDSLIQYFSLDKIEGQYFRDLITLCHSEDPRERELLGRLLKQIRLGSRGKRVTASDFTVIAHWYCYALRELVTLPDFKEDPDWIRKRLRFNLSTEIILKALRDLEVLGILRRDDCGKLAPSDEFICTEEDTLDHSRQIFLHEGFEIGLRSLTEIPPADREITAGTLCFSKDDLSEAKQAIRDFMIEFIARFDKPRGQDVFHLQIALNPLTQKTGKGL